MQPQTKTGWEGALWGVAGLVVGGAIVFLAVNAQKQTPPVLPPQAPARVAREAAPADPIPTMPEVPIGAGEPVPDPAHPESSKPVGEASPAPLPPPGPQLGGTLPLGTPYLGGNTPMKVDLPPTEVRAPEVQFARLNVYTSDATNARNEMLAFAASRGAETRTFVDYGTAEHDPSEGVLVMVAEKDADEFVRYVLSKNSNVAEQRYRITPAARQARIQDEAQTALFALKAKRQKLLVKYLEDADPVKEVEEQMAQAEAAIKRLRIAEEEQTLAAIKVTFGPRG